MDRTEEVQMRTLENQPEGQREEVFEELNPVDRGRDAWTVLIAGFAFEALFWGTFRPL